MHTELKAGSLSFIESMVMGVAGSAPATPSRHHRRAARSRGRLVARALVIFAIRCWDRHRLQGAEQAARVGGRRLPVDDGGISASSGASSRAGAARGSMVFMVTGSLPLATSTARTSSTRARQQCRAERGGGQRLVPRDRDVLIVGIEVTSRVQNGDDRIELSSWSSC